MIQGEVNWKDDFICHSFSVSFRLSFLDEKYDSEGNLIAKLQKGGM